LQLSLVPVGVLYFTGSYDLIAVLIIYFFENEQATGSFRFLSYTSAWHLT
jgi:hypothetical protein